MSSVQTILANQNATQSVTTDWYKTEQRGAWSLDVTILESCGNHLEITMEVSNDQENAKCFKIINEKIHKSEGVSFIGKLLPFDYCRWVISETNCGRYKVLFNERD
jgi:hypothetical protein